MIPWLCRRYRTKIISTRVTAEIAEVLQRDSLKVAKAEGYSIPYSAQDISNALRNWVEIKPRSAYEIGDAKIIAHWAGHIPGALMFEIRDGAKPVRGNTLFLEGTYAGREHRDRRELEKEFIDQIEDVLARNGRVIIPAFGVGRSQEVALILKDKGFQVWGDGMGNKIAKIYLKNPAYISSAGELSNAVRGMRVETEKGLFEMEL
jgi:putative mRNA 3-end processing factor